jgi:carbohydrate esterase-like protein/GDSL-like lipase/acylhydrolase family protein
MPSTDSVKSAYLVFMKRFNEVLLILITQFIMGSCSGDQEIFVPYSDSHIAYEGRIDTSRVQAADLYWPGSSIKINFEGESIEALLKESKGENYYNVIVDDDSLYILRPDTRKKYHMLASNLSSGSHTIELFKRTEWDRGRTTFYGFRISEEGSVEAKSPEKKRKIEFYGNSITAGYAVEDTTGGDSPDSTYTNNYLSYASLIARHYDAEYHCTSKGGIGITISWFPLIMPEAYDRLDPLDPSSQWNFSRYQPDIIVINLMQNDSWLVYKPDHSEFKARFGDNAPGEEDIISAYQSFVEDIRRHYPASYIICALGNMDATQEGSVWPGYVSQAVDNLNDSRILTHYVAYKETPGHPSVSEQQDMADSFIHFIDENISW